LRIISGTHKGRKIQAPRNLPVRPTTDQAREGLFNILYHQWDFKGLEVLDLFAGTGSVSYEFASRGAASITSVDINHSCVKFINETITRLDLPQIKPIRDDAFHFISRTKYSYDIIFADPPYNLKGIEALPEMVLKKEILRDEGNFILEHPSDFNFSSHPGFTKLRKYSRVHFSFFRKG
jgi:16S rRNA (guanine(966)-N(2))-methyltransferase RsmD